MSSIIERALELGLGAIALTKDKVEAVVEDLVQTRQVPEERGRELVNRLLERGKEAREEISELIRKETAEVLHRANLVPRSEVEALEARVAGLEAKLGLTAHVAEATPESGNPATPQVETLLE
jgi:polyhydroxyalkanoate synthesis regulator phasin